MSNDFNPADYFVKGKPMSDEEFKEYMKLDDSHEKSIEEVKFYRQPMLQYEEKFIVINKKHIDSLSPALRHILKCVLDEIKCEIPDNRYYTCNQDEPYAGKVLETILSCGENITKLENRLLALDLLLTEAYNYIYSDEGTYHEMCVKAEAYFKEKI